MWGLPQVLRLLGGWKVGLQQAGRDEAPPPVAPALAGALLRLMQAVVALLPLGPLAAPRWLRLCEEQGQAAGWALRPQRGGLPQVPWAQRAGRQELRQLLGVAVLFFLLLLL